MAKFLYLFAELLAAYPNQAQEAGAQEEQRSGFGDLTVNPHIYIRGLVPAIAKRSPRAVLNKAPA